MNDRDIAERHAKWNERVNDRLPLMLVQLLNSDAYGLGKGRALPPKNHGIYLLSEGNEPRYAGRTGLTERAKRAGEGYSNFQTRLRGHVQASHSSGTYAYWQACEVFREKGLPLGTSRAANCKNPTFMQEFKRQCERVKAMDMRVIEIKDDALAVVFEVYVATVLGLPQSFATS